MFERVFPAGDADAPFVTRFQSRKTPFGMRCDEIVSIEHGKIEKLARGLNADGVQTNIFRTGATKSIAIESGHWIATATLQFCAQHVCRHDLKLIVSNNRSTIEFRARSTIRCSGFS